MDEGWVGGRRWMRRMEEEGEGEGERVGGGGHFSRKGGVEMV